MCDTMLRNMSHRPFDPALYEDEVEDENEILDEEGRARLKLKVKYILYHNIHWWQLHLSASYPSM